MKPDSPTPAALSYAKVAINRPLAQSYTYYIPESMSERLRVGSLVRVPLRNQEVEGVVVDIASHSDLKGVPIKPIMRHLSPGYAIDKSLAELAGWMADYYFCSLGEALATVSMIGLNDLTAPTRTLYQLAHAEHWLAVSRDEGPGGQRATAGHKAVVSALLADGNRPLEGEALRELASVGEGVIKTMLQRGWLTQVAEEIATAEPEEESESGPAPLAPLKLTPAQQEAYDALQQSLHEGQYRAWLIHGVTGSGKTELYLRLIEEALRMGRTAIVLVPEIALTPQTVDSFRRRLGSVVGVYHSRLSLGEKFELWRRIASHQTRVVIGARSALFSPMPRLGVVIVDEEHEASYKQGETPRYHARDMAVVRAARAGAIAVLGSATPSIESLHNAREGKYGLLRLPERVGPHASPIMTVVDMKRVVSETDLAAGSEPLLSPILREAIDKRLKAGEQSLLLLNRRGFANHVLCLKCDHQFVCPECDVPLTYHKVGGERMVCHWCGHREPVPRMCPHCQAPEVHTLGMGTQRIEEVLTAMFPTARAIRIDMDSMRRKGAYEEAWRKINAREIDIILGTQMIAKGLHLESVTLVGVISADFALFMPDFRAAERTYQLLTQVAGRAGRGDRPGEVIVQSFIPHHYAIDLAARLAESTFYERELHLRRMLRFPPFARLASILMSGKDPARVREQAEQLAGILKTIAYRPKSRSVRVLGPTPAPLARLEGKWRWRLLIRGERPGDIHALLADGLHAYEKQTKRQGADMTIDVDPIDLL